MEATGRLNGFAKDWNTAKYLITFALDSLPADVNELKGCDALDITAKRHRKKRSLNANALMWKCLGDIAQVLLTDKWSVYLEMLKRYGEYTYICIHPDAVEMMKRQWRECEEVGRLNINGHEAVELLCYYGSSTYDTKQFSRLLDGVISDMKEMGLETPSEEELRRSIEAWGNMNEQAKAD